MVFQIYLESTDGHGDSEIVKEARAVIEARIEADSFDAALDQGEDRLAAWIKQARAKHHWGRHEPTGLDGLVIEVLELVGNRV